MRFFKQKSAVMRGVIAFMLILSIGSSQAFGSASAVTSGGTLPGGQTEDSDDEYGSIAVDFSAEAYFKEKTYMKMLNEYADKGYKPAEDAEVVLTPWDITDSSSSGTLPVYTGTGGRTEPSLVWSDNTEWYEWSFTAPKDGLYEIYVDYLPLDGSGSMIQRAIAIDGEIQFKEAHNISFYRVWRESGDTRFNNIGDEVWPKQVEDFIWQHTAVVDNQGYYDHPLQFYFTAGLHTIRLTFVDQPMAIGNITVKTPETVPSYAEALREYQSKGYKPATQSVRFEAEITDYRSDPTIRRESSNDPACSPTTPGNRILNIMGARRWRRGNQSITWQFEAPEDGLYKIDMRMMQNYEDGLPSYRQIEIDGKIPFEELRCYRFAFDRNWQRETISDENGNPYLFYLTKGTHDITMTVKSGPIYEVIEKSMDDILLLSELYRKVIMITSPNPDPNYEYDLSRNIPGLVDDLTYLAGRMDEIAITLTSVSSKVPSVANNFIQIRDQLQKMAKDTDIIPRALSDLDNAQINIGTYLISLQSAPLAVDYFIVSPPEYEIDMRIRSTFLERAYVTAVNFFGSFTKDYNSIGNVYVENSTTNTVIDVWIARGREWGEILKEMADEDFTPKTGISINMNILPTNQVGSNNINTLLLSITSGRAPDVAMGVGSTSPTEFAFREAVADLRQFGNFNEVYDRFYPSIFAPLEYRGGIFALPETMNFTVMFYRTDIVQEIGMLLPQTWDDVRNHTLPKLYENTMNFNMPFSLSGSNSLSSTGGNLSLFLFQHRGSYYKNNGTESALDTPEAYTAFREWTEFYTNYGIPTETSFFTRFRSGDSPIGIGSYSQYMQLSTSAPELYGRWSIAPVPGIMQADGTIDRSVGSMTGETIMIMQQSQKKDAAWQFLDWWTSEETQMRYGRELEALLGVEARWNTANKNAFNSLSWNKDHLEVIQYQLSQTKEIPVVLGGYFTSRHISNAWNRIVLKGESVRDSLEQAVLDINKELKAKQEEYKYKPNGD